MFHNDLSLKYIKLFLCLSFLTSIRKILRTRVSTNRLIKKKKRNRLTEEIREQRKPGQLWGFFETRAAFTFSLPTCRYSPASPVLVIPLALDSHGNCKTKQIHRILELD